MNSKTFANRYDIIETIGSGGMGVVYKATDTLLDKTVALKVLTEKVSGKAALRFQAEAKAAAKLHHKNIVMAIDFGVSEDGEPYMVQEYVEGVTLSTLLRPHGLRPIEQALDIFTQLSDALIRAHKAGIIHRDIKPSNVIVANIDGTLVAKLADFGLAKFIEDDLGLTRTGATMGTPLYMSPEQTKAEELDARSDIYSLGCLMYETISGYPPIVGESALETAKLRLTTKPEPLSAVTDVPIPVFLEKIIAKCLRIDKDRRYQFAAQLSRDLSEVAVVYKEFVKDQDAAHSNDDTAHDSGDGSEDSGDDTEDWGNDSTDSIEDGDADSDGISDDSRDGTATGVRDNNANNLRWAAVLIPLLILLSIGLWYAFNPSEPEISEESQAPIDGYRTSELSDSTAWIRGKEENPFEYDKRSDKLQLKNTTPEQLKEVVTKYPKLNNLEIDDTEFDGRDLKILAPLTQLNCLKLLRTPLEDKQLQNLALLKHLNKIKFEYIPPMNGKGFSVLSELKLNDIEYMNSPVNEQIIKDIAKSSATVVNLKGCRGLNAAALAHFQKMRSLRQLSLDETNISDSALAALRGMHLEALKLESNQNLTVACLSTIKTMKGLQFIAFDSCNSIPVADRVRLGEELKLQYDKTEERLFYDARQR